MRYGLIGFQVLLWNGTYLAISWLLTLPGRHKLQERYGEKKRKWKPSWRMMVFLTFLSVVLHWKWLFT